MLLEKWQIEEINDYLAKEFGYFSIDLPNFRIVWANDQFEIRITKYNDSGIELLQPETRKLPKYIQWAKDKYILERAFGLPEGVETDLVAKYSYEPIWTFDKTPTWETVKFVVECALRSQKKATGAKYKNPEDDPKISKEVKEARIKKLQDELFGDENDTTDALTYKEGIVVPNNYEGAD